MTDRIESADQQASPPRFVVFAGAVRLAHGDLASVAAAAHRAQEEHPNAGILAFDRQTAEMVELDLRGTEQEVAVRHAQPAAGAPRRGRPRLGVVAREVTLLPRHWDWLAKQSGGASTTLRRLVEAARKDESGAVRMRADAAYRFMSAMAGDLPGFEEAARALFAGDRDRLARLLSPWPSDIGDEVLRFASGPPDRD